MSATFFTGVQIWMEIYLPKLFELMTEPDIVTILNWYVAPGDVVQPGANLVEVWAPGRRITIPTPPELTTPYRVVEIAKGEKLRMGDFLIKLEPETSSSSI